MLTRGRTTLPEPYWASPDPSFPAASAARPLAANNNRLEGNRQEVFRLVCANVGVGRAVGRSLVGGVNESAYLIRCVAAAAA
ncbi:MAG: hypothetical protein ACO1SX_20085 [Actinomycetota bacterium]